MFTFIPLVLLVHIFEELPNFPSWATRHFGKTTLRWYLVSHAILYPLVLLVSFMAARGEGWWIFMALVVQAVIFTNGIFHVITTFLFREYSPGVISSVFVTFPFTYLFFNSLFQNNPVSYFNLIIGFTIGTVISLLIIASLYINFDSKILKR